MGVLKTDAVGPFLEIVLGGLCPVCEQAIPWQPEGAVSGSWVGEHPIDKYPECGLRFSAVAQQIQVTVMDLHGTALVEVNTPDGGIQLVAKAGAHQPPAPARKRATIVAAGQAALDLGDEFPRPAGSVAGA